MNINTILETLGLLDTALKLLTIFSNFWKEILNIISPINDVKDIIALIIKAPYILITLIIFLAIKLYNWLRYGKA